MVSYLDRHLFRSLVKGAKVLKQDTIQPQKKKPAPEPIQTRKDEQDIIRNLLSMEFDPTEHENGEELLFIRSGIQRRSFRKLRRGEYSIEHELDLHGLTVPQAREALIQFLRVVRFRGFRCVRVVHGKGLRSPGKKPVLKEKVFHWLKQRDEVLALCSARSADGGTGAIYVILRKK